MLNQTRNINLNLNSVGECNLVNFSGILDKKYIWYIKTGTIIFIANNTVVKKILCLKFRLSVLEKILQEMSEATEGAVDISII